MVTWSRSKTCCPALFLLQNSWLIEETNSWEAPGSTTTALYPSSILADWLRSLVLHTYTLEMASLSSSS